jgi:hypothetical protein
MEHGSEGKVIALGVRVEEPGQTPFGPLSGHAGGLLIEKADEATGRSFQRLLPLPGYKQSKQRLIQRIARFLDIQRLGDEAHAGTVDGERAATLFHELLEAILPRRLDVELMQIAVEVPLHEIGRIHGVHPPGERKGKGTATTRGNGETFGNSGKKGGNHRQKTGGRNGGKNGNGEPNALKHRKSGKRTERLPLQNDPVQLRAVAQGEGIVRIVKEQDDPTDAGVLSIEEHEGLAVHPGRPGESDEGRGIGADLDAGHPMDIQSNGHDKNLREAGEPRSSV